MAKMKKTFGQLVKSQKQKSLDQQEKQEERIKKSLETIPGVRVTSANGQAPHGVVKARAGTGKTFTLIVGIAYIVWGWITASKLQLTPEARAAGKRQGAEFWAMVTKYVGFEPVPSSQQKQVWDFIGLEKFKSVTYCAFNKSIVTEFSEKWKWLINALNLFGVELKFATIHALGFRATVKAYNLRGYNLVNDYIIQKHLEDIWQVDLREIWKEKADQVKAIEDLVNLAMQTLTYKEVEAINKSEPLTSASRACRRLEVTEEMVEQLAGQYDIELPESAENLARIVTQILNLMREPHLGKITNTQMIWLPVVNDLPVLKAELGLVDEGQDLNRCQKALIVKMFDRIILVGDERQAIYGFAGADVTSIPDFEEQMKPTPRGVESMRLTVTRRCGKAIVELARQIVPDFEAHENNPEGSICNLNREEALEKMDKGDMVLCRTNAPIVGLAFALLKENRSVNIQGRDISKNLLGFIRKSGQKEIGAFIDWLDKHQDEQMQRMQKRKQKDEMAMMTLTDKVAVLKAFAEGASSLGEMQDKIKQFGQLCKGDGKSGNANVILLSSVHRAKGLESKRVYILHPELMPHPMAKSEWARGQEENLKYVAQTRAIEELIFVIGE